VPDLPEGTRAAEKNMTAPPSLYEEKIMTAVYPTAETVYRSIGYLQQGTAKISLSHAVCKYGTLEVSHNSGVVTSIPLGRGGASTGAEHVFDLPVDDYYYAALTTNETCAVKVEFRGYPLVNLDPFDDYISPTTACPLPFTNGSSFCDFEAVKHNTSTWFKATVDPQKSYVVTFEDCGMEFEVSFFTSSGGQLVAILYDANRTKTYNMKCGDVRVIAFPHLPPSPSEIYIRATATYPITLLVQAARVRIQEQPTYLPYTELEIELPTSASTASTRWSSTVIDIPDDRLSDICIHMKHACPECRLTASLLVSARLAYANDGEAGDVANDNLNIILADWAEDSAFDNTACFSTRALWRNMQITGVEELYLADLRAYVRLDQPSSIAAGTIAIQMTPQPLEISDPPCINTWPDAAALPVEATLNLLALPEISDKAMVLCPGSAVFYEFALAQGVVGLTVLQNTNPSQPLRIVISDDSNTQRVNATINATGTPDLYFSVTWTVDTRINITNIGTAAVNMVILLVEGCEGDTYRDAGACFPVTDCGIGYYEAKDPTLTSDRLCVAYTNCTDTQYLVATPTFTSDRVCANHTRCTSAQYQTQPPNAVLDRGCAALTVCTVNEYELVPPLVNQDRVCASTTQCTADEREHAPPTNTSDRICLCRDDVYWANYSDSAIPIPANTTISDMISCSGNIDEFVTQVAEASRYRITVSSPSSAQMAMRLVLHSEAHDETHVGIFTSDSSGGLRGDFVATSSGELVTEIDGGAPRTPYTIAIQQLSFCGAGKGEAPDGSCVMCAAGYFSAGPPAVVCSQCPPGSYSERGAVLCMLCPAGKYSQYQAPECSQCEVGKYQENAGESICKECLPGTTSADPFIACHSEGAPQPAPPPIPPAPTSPPSTTERSNETAQVTTTPRSSSATTTADGVSQTTTEREDEGEGEDLSPGETAAVVVGSLAAVAFLASLTYAIIYKVIPAVGGYAKVGAHESALDLF
jgi:hypothetical protein